MPATLSGPVSLIESGDHACLSFASDRQQRGAVTQFVARGLSADEKVYCLVDADLAAVPRFLERQALPPARPSIGVSWSCSAPTTRMYPAARSSPRRWSSGSAG